MAKRKRRKPLSLEPAVEPAEEWLLTYADSITLLMCFFVITTGISHIDLKTFEEVSGAFSEGFGKRDTVRPIASLESKLHEVLSDLEISSDTVLGTDPKGVVLEFPSNIFFRDGSSGLKRGAVGPLDEIINELEDPKYNNYEIVIEAHSEKGASSGIYKSLWDLTSIRAANLARYFTHNTTIDASRVLAISFGDSRPRGLLAQIETKDGDRDALPINERVVFRMRPVSGRAGGRVNILAVDGG